MSSYLLSYIQYFQKIFKSEKYIKSSKKEKILMTSGVSNTALKCDLKNQIFQSCSDVQENSTETFTSRTWQEFSCVAPTATQGQAAIYIHL